MSSTSTVVSLLTMRCDGDNNLIGEAGKSCSMISFILGVVITVATVTAYYFNTMNTASAVVLGLTGVGIMAGGLTGYLAISVIALGIFSTVVFSAPDSAWELPKAAVVIVPK